MSTALLINPRWVNAYVSRAAVKLKIEDYAGAMVDCDKALVIQPAAATAYLNRGTANGGLKNYDGAVKDYRKALDLRANYEEARNGLEEVQSLERQARAGV